MVARHRPPGHRSDPLTTSPEDLTRWVLALRTGAVGGVAVTAAMAERTRLRDGTPIHYGLGLAVRRYRGLTVLCHSGSQPGYKAHIAYIPDRDVGVVILSNREDTRPTALAASILEEAIGRDSPDDPPPRRGGASTAPASRATRPRSRGATSTSTRAMDGARDRRRRPARGDASAIRSPSITRAAAVPRRRRLPGDGPRRAALRLRREDGGVGCRLDLGGQVMTLRRGWPQSDVLLQKALAGFAGGNTGARRSTAVTACAWTAMGSGDRVRAGGRRRASCSRWSRSRPTCSSCGRARRASRIATCSASSATARHGAHRRRRTMERLKALRLGRGRERPRP